MQKKKKKKDWELVWMLPTSRSTDNLIAICIDDLCCNISGRARSVW
jgi:hypothetical protein